MINARTLYRLTVTAGIALLIVVVYGLFLAFGGNWTAVLILLSVGAYCTLAHWVYMLERRVEVDEGIIYQTRVDIRDMRNGLSPDDAARRGGV